MAAAPGSLDSLLTYEFTENQWSAVSNLSVTATAVTIDGNGTYIAPALETITATAAGTPFLYSSNANFTIVAVSDVHNTVTINEVVSGSSIGVTTLCVVGYTGAALLLSGANASEFATTSQAGLSDLQPVTSILSTGQVTDTGTVTFSADYGIGGVACFARGTRIRTVLGDVVVEALRPGDLVPTEVSRRLSRVRWVGRRTLEMARQPYPWDVAPVRVKADAFGPGVPARDLLLSPDHAVMLDGVLIPIRYLRNGATIAQEAMATVTYFHVELDAHDVLLAEGLPAESFLDTGNRGAFENAAGPVDLSPAFARRVWAARGCLPLLTGGEVVKVARRRLADRARALGWRLTKAPALRIEAAGRVLPVIRDGTAWRVMLPCDIAEVRLRSRAVLPAERVVNGDGRRLGVALAGLRLDGAAPSPAAFGAGWHADEGDFRWTDGDASLAVSGARALRFRLAWREKYWLPPVAAWRSAPRATQAG